MYKNHLNPPQNLNSETPFLTAYGPKIKTSITFPPDEGRTKQSFKDECDINLIMARYAKTGVIEFAEKHEPQYGDCTGIEFQAGMLLIARAQEMFDDLPSQIRSRFDNNPSEFLDFVQNPENRAECAKMGLLKEQPVTGGGTSSPPPKDAVPDSDGVLAVTPAAKGAKATAPQTNSST